MVVNTRSSETIGYINKHTKLLVIILLFICMENICIAQEHSIIESELILTYSDLPSCRPRLSILNISVPINLNLRRGNFIKTEINLRNLGLIYKDSIKISARAYGIGTSLAYVRYISEGRNLALGIGYEYLFHYKQKIFLDTKIKDKEFLSEKLNPHQPSIFFEYYTQKNIGIRIGYYFLNFFNENYSVSSEELELTPFFESNTHIIYISLRFGLLTSSF